MNTNANGEIYRAQWSQTKWLVLSSLFFMFPATYAYMNKLYSYWAILVVTSIISANYWRKATYSWRRDLDLAVAKFSFIVFSINAILYVRKIHYVIPLYSGFIVLTYCYHTSGKLSDAKNDNFYKYHFGFHCFLTLGQFIIIQSVFEDRLLQRRLWHL